MTPLIHLYLLASGSKGNAAVVEGPQGSVLVDCGISRKELRRRAALVDCDLGRVCAILVTHEHSDHVGGLPVICKHFDGPVYATAGTASCTRLAPFDVTTVQHGCQLALGGMCIQAFPLSHDVADPMAFRFEVPGDDGPRDAVGWATDTGVLTDEARHALRGCRTLGIETNHDPDMLASGPYPYYLKARVGGSRGHLSNLQAAEALPDLVTSHTETVIGMHVSEKNNLPELATKALVKSLEDTDFSPRVRMASQTQPLVVW